MLFHYREPQFFKRRPVQNVRGAAGEQKRKHYSKLTSTSRFRLRERETAAAATATAGEPRRIKEMRLRLNRADYNLRAQKPTLWEGAAAPPDLL